MQVVELLETLGNLWPRHFEGERGNAWIEAYQSMLKPYEGKVLASAWDITFRSHKRSTAPLPADILAHCTPLTPARNTTAQGYEKADRLRARTKEYWQGWKRNHMEWAKAAHQEGWLMDLYRHVEKIAHVAAQYDSYGDLHPEQSAAAYYGRREWVTADDIEIFREQRRSRDNHGKRIAA